MENNDLRTFGLFSTKLSIDRRCDRTPIVCFKKFACTYAKLLDKKLDDYFGPGIQYLSDSSLCAGVSLSLNSHFYSFYGSPEYSFTRVFRVHLGIPL